MGQKLFVTDYDGTLAGSKGYVSQENIRSLIRLGTANTVRVIATGRSLFSAMKVLDSTFPLDYLIFSSGAGIMNWKTKELIYQQHLSHAEAVYIKNYLISQKMDFMIHFPIPDNHCFFYHRFNKDNIDFENRIKLYQDFAKTGHNHILDLMEVSQFLVVESTDMYLTEQISRDLKEFTIIRTTSPLDHQSLWVEIFHKDVMKSLAINRLSGILNILRNDIYAIGNDFNDLDMLEWSYHSFVVDNAPDEMKRRIKTVATADRNGFSEAVDLFLNHM